MGAVDALYERFEKNLQAVNGNSWLANKADAAGIIANAYKEAGIGTACICVTPFLEELGVVKALSDAGIEVFTDHIRLHAETAKGGVSEAECAIADLGSVVQLSDDIDGRIGRDVLKRAGIDGPFVTATSHNVGMLLRLSIQGVGACVCPQIIVQNMLTQQQADSLWVFQLGEVSAPRIQFGCQAQSYQWSVIEKFISCAKATSC